MLAGSSSRISLLAWLGMCIVAGFAQAESRELLMEPHDEQRKRVVPLKVYLSESDQPAPVILFSHGLGGSRENNRYLGMHWADHGYAAVFVQHAGSDEDVWKSVRLAERMGALKAAASVDSALQRHTDVTFVIDQLTEWNRQAGHALHGRLNLERIGMSGHSFGAVTTMAVAGRKFPFNRDFREPRIDAFLAMSPQPGKGVPPDAAFGHLDSPILCMTGTRDASPIDAGLKPADRRKVFAAMPDGNKYQLVLDGAQHFAFGDAAGRRTRVRNPRHHPAIQKISLQFWDAYLKDDAEAKDWLRSQRVIPDSGLGEGDVWEWK